MAHPDPLPPGLGTYPHVRFGKKALWVLATLFLYGGLVVAAVACVQVWGPFGDLLDSLLVGGTLVGGLALVVFVSVRLQSGKPVEQRVYVTQVRGFRGVFRARRERSERLGLGLTVLILIALAAARILRPEGQPVHLELALGLASLVWLLWAGAYVRGYRGMVRRYRVDPKGTIWVPGPDGEHPVRLEEYGRVQARRGSESGTYRQGGVNKGYWQRIELRKPIGEARALTFVCRGTWSETHDVPVMAYVVANYFHSACKRAGLTLSGPPSSGWSARRTEGEGGASTDPWDPEAMGVRVQGTLVMPDGRTVDVDERIDAHNLLDDEILDTVESLVQGAHPGGRWADRSQVKVNRGGPRSSN